MNFLESIGSRVYNIITLARADVIILFFGKNKCKVASIAYTYICSFGL